MAEQKKPVNALQAVLDRKVVQQPASLSPYRLSHGVNRGEDKIFFVSSTVFI